MITLYECEVCGKQYSKASECFHCEAHQVAKSRFEAGEEVYVKQRYPDDRTKPVVAVKVVAVWTVGHSQRYQLSHFVEYSKGSYIGGKIRTRFDVTADEFESYDAAFEGTLMAMGDDIWMMKGDGHFDDIPLTEAMINRDAKLRSTE